MEQLSLLNEKPKRLRAPRLAPSHRERELAIARIRQSLKTGRQRRFMGQTR